MFNELIQQYGFWIIGYLVCFILIMYKTISDRSKTPKKKRKGKSLDTVSILFIMVFSSLSWIGVIIALIYFALLKNFQVQ